jgi:hypothetical protein
MSDPSRYVVRSSTGSHWLRMRGKHEFYVLPAAGRADDAKPIVAACTSREAADAARRLLSGEP